MKKNDLIASFGALVSVILFLAFLWLIGQYPLIAIGGIVLFLIWNLYRMVRELIQSILDDGEGK